MKGGGPVTVQQESVALCMAPHARTLRKARERVKWMVKDGVSRPTIRHYLIQWLGWWTKTSDTWKKSELAARYVESCWNINMAVMGSAVFQRYLTLPGEIPACGKIAATA